MFDDFFEVILADDAETREAHHRLRFEVYCRETGFENSAEFPDGCERDAFDHTAAHFLVRSRLSEEWIAAMRIVVAPVAELPLASYLDREHTQGPLHGAEISRFCVSPRYRRRTSQQVRIERQEAGRGTRDAGREGDGAPRAECLVAENRPVSSLLESRDPWILIGLLRAARQYGEERGIANWFFLAASSMVSAACAAGFSMSHCGPEIEHRGRRRAYRFEWDGAENRLAERSPQVARMFVRRPAYRLGSQFAASPDSFLCAVSGGAGVQSQVLS